MRTACFLAVSNRSLITLETTFDHLKSAIVIHSGGFYRLKHPACYRGARPREYEYNDHQKLTCIYIYIVLYCIKLSYDKIIIVCRIGISLSEVGQQNYQGNMKRTQKKTFAREKTDL